MVTATGCTRTGCWPRSGRAAEPTTLDLAFVAEGALDACVMMSNKPWDTAAGALLAREAGALVTDAAGDSHTHQSDSIVAATPAIAGELATVINAANAVGAPR
jgi:myo-inositol-1(or 4)-monophosphatase